MAQINKEPETEYARAGITIREVDRFINSDELNFTRSKMNIPFSKKKKKKLGSKWIFDEYLQSNEQRVAIVSIYSNEIAVAIFISNSFFYSENNIFGKNFPWILISTF